MTNPKQLRNLIFNLSFRAGIAALVIALMLVVVAAQSAQAQTYDAAADFEQGFINQTNPNGVWAYGWSTSFTTPITLYDETAQPGINGPNAQYWISSSINYGESPSAEFNDGQAYDDGNVDFLPYEFLLVSGIAGQYSDLVFTAPASGMYSVTGSFRGCQYGIGVVVGIVVNGNVIFNSTVSAEGQVVPFDTNLTLAAGDTVIFSVGPNGGLQNTGLAATITRQTGTFTVLHNFTGGQDGANPRSGLTLDQAGKNLYGTAFNGGTYGVGTAYQLKHKGSTWPFNLLYTFTGGNDGANPTARVVFGPNGTLYGTTLYDGAGGAGTVFNLRPFPSVCKAALCPWMKIPLYAFAGGTDGAFPELADLLFDPSGNIYGTTYNGGTGNDGYGTVYELMPESGGGYTESVLYSFQGSDGDRPVAGVTLDPSGSGNLYGTTTFGGDLNCTVVYQPGCGTVYELMPAGGGWKETVLYTFENGNDGSLPFAGLIFDLLGKNLYGATNSGGSGGGGTIFELTPSNSGWTLNTLYSFTGAVCDGFFGAGPWGTLSMDGAGNLFGTTVCDGAYRYGNVFELSPSGSGWTYTDLHDFTGGNDGAYPISDFRQGR
jgi:uncharacterized repeat protein (TIGR03803 family)